MDIQNELVWSHSRGRALKECPRAYWFTYYGSWGGWDAEAPGEARQAYIEKKLTSRAMWTGSVVHGIAQSGLERAVHAARRGVPPREWPLEEMRERANRVVNEDIVGSETGQWLERPSRRTGFAEHYYALPVTHADWDAAADEVDRQVVNLHGNRIYQRLLVTAARIREVEVLQRFAVGDPAVGAQVYLAMDALVGDGKGGVVIIDWKTGDSHDDAVIASQLGIYGLYATEVLGVPDDRIVAMHVNLRHNTETRHPVGPAEIAAAREEVVAGFREMQAVLTDPVNNTAEKGSFPELPPGSARCRRCNFRRSCGREGAQDPQAESASPGAAPP